MSIEEGPLRELLLQALEAERGGVEIYETAVQCAVHRDLRQEWQQILAHARERVRTLIGVCDALGFDPDDQTPARNAVRLVDQGLVDAMRQARRAGGRTAAELVACECVVAAETKRHLHWELIEELSRHVDGAARSALASAADEVDQEGEHPLHLARGWARELWLDALGVPALLPPPEETRLATTAGVPPLREGRV